MHSLISCSRLNVVRYSRSNSLIGLKKKTYFIVEQDVISLLIDHDHPSGLFDVFIASVENVVFVVSVVSVVADIKVRFEALAATDDLEFVAAQQKNHFCLLSSFSSSSSSAAIPVSTISLSQCFAYERVCACVSMCSRVRARKKRESV